MSTFLIQYWSNFLSLKFYFNQEFDKDGWIIAKNWDSVKEGYVRWQKLRWWKICFAVTVTAIIETLFRIILGKKIYCKFVKFVTMLYSKYNTKDKVIIFLNTEKWNANSLYHFFCSILCSTNNHLQCICLTFLIK